uniref:MULE transposase domain-containing protein n=1 Tax=Plectus sambesii TaxID=2011161 RepID=A0A914XIQ2_9BILA
MFTTREQLRAHVVEQHEANAMQVEEQIFDSALEFEKWLEEARKAHCVDFVTRSGGGIRTRYMACSRSGLSKAKWTVDADRVARFPVRTGEECTAFLRTKEREDGKIEARYCLQHFGHEKEPARLRLSKSEKEHIVNLVQEDHNVDWVLNKIQELHSDKESERLYFASRKDVRAVVEQYGLTKGRRDANDMQSVKLWVDEDAASTSPWKNFFSYQPAVNSDGDGFYLGIMTEEQRDLLKQYAYRGVCVDSTHNCTRYKYKLVTLLVFDDIGRGRPCAFYFCKEESAEQLLPFFREVRERCGPLTPEVLMSDDNNAFWNAWREVFDVSNTHKILCAWHVMRNWALNKGKIEDKERQQHILEQLYLLHREPRRIKFDQMLVEILTMLDEEVEYKSYLQSTYLNTEERIKEWAPYSRAGLVAHTNMAVERWHRTLKRTYLNGSQNSRIDQVLFYLFKAIEDLNRECDVQANRKVLNNQYRIRETHRRHKNGYIFYAAHLEMIKPGPDAETWLIQSRTAPDLWYTVSKRRTCKCSIEARCRLCGMCWEEFSCECPDSIRSGTACAHVHAVVSLKTGQRPLNELLQRSRAPLLGSLDVDHPTSSTEAPLELELEENQESDATKQWSIRCSQGIAALKPMRVAPDNRVEYEALLKRLIVLQSVQPEIEPRHRCQGRPSNAPPVRSSSAPVVDRRTAINKRRRDEREGTSQASQAKRATRYVHMDPSDVQFCRKCLKSDDPGCEAVIEWIQCEGPCGLWFHNMCYNDTICDFC